MKTEKLLKMLDELRKKINDNENSDGTCDFDGELIYNMLEITLRMVDNSPDND